MRRVLAFVTAALLAATLLAVAQPASPRTIEIQVGDSMRFNPARIDAQPDERLRVVVKDVGTMPKAAMAHDFVLLRMGVDPKAFADRTARSGNTNYIPPMRKGEILASTALIGPGETAEVTFTSPRQAGQYTFICTFPGHFLAGMRGTLVVAPRDMPR